MDLNAEPSPTSSGISSAVLTPMPGLDVQDGTVETTQHQADAEPRDNLGHTTLNSASATTRRTSSTLCELVQSPAVVDLRQGIAIGSVSAAFVTANANEWRGEHFALPSTLNIRLCQSETFHRALNWSSASAGWS